MAMKLLSTYSFFANVTAKKAADSEFQDGINEKRKAEETC
jgi:hypothetical protein